MTEQHTDVNRNAEKDPAEWVTGGEPVTGP